MLLWRKWCLTCQRAVFVRLSVWSSGHSTWWGTHPGLAHLRWDWWQWLHLLTAAVGSSAPRGASKILLRFLRAAPSKVEQDVAQMEHNRSLYCTFKCLQRWATLWPEGKSVANAPAANEPAQRLNSAAGEIFPLRQKHRWGVSVHLSTSGAPSYRTHQTLCWRVSAPNSPGPPAQLCLPKASVVALLPAWQKPCFSPLVCLRDGINLDICVFF